MNSWKAWIMMACLSMLLVVAGGALGGQSGALIAFGLALIMNFGGYWFSDKIVLKMSRAVPLEEHEVPELHSIVRNLCSNSGLPVPKLYLIRHPQPNAFATGRNPRHAAVAVTQGLMDLVNKRELEGVIAHELSHIRNRDILIGSMAATLAGAITMLADMAQWALIFGGMRNDEGEDNIGGLIGTLLVMIIAPIAATLIQLAISRSREYLADQTAARMTGSPSGLADALKKMAYGTRTVPMKVNPATSHMYIVNPLRGGGITTLFSTHPPIEDRIKRLERMAG